MPSMRPSQYAMQQRTDGGPFLRIERDDLEQFTLVFASATDRRSAIYELGHAI
mgnify:CR=1 FL=1